MSTDAIGASGAHPSYLYAIMMACVIGLILLCLSSIIARRGGLRRPSGPTSEPEASPAYPSAPSGESNFVDREPQATRRSQGDKAPTARGATPGRQSGSDDAARTRTAARPAAAKKTSVAKKRSPSSD